MCIRDSNWSDSCSGWSDWRDGGYSGYVRSASPHSDSISGYVEGYPTHDDWPNHSGGGYSDSHGDNVGYNDHGDTPHTDTHSDHSDSSGSDHIDPVSYTHLTVMGALVPGRFPAWAVWVQVALL